MAWSDEDVAPQTWRVASPVLLSMPEDELIGLSSALGFWLKRVSKAPDVGPEFFELIRSVVYPLRNQETDLGDNPLMHAWNNSVGIVAESS